MRRTEPALGAWLRIDKASDQPLAEQIYGAIHEQIVHGRLRSGYRLPSTRALSLALGISRSTVAVAFERLIADGFVEGHVGSGTYVSRRAIVNSLRAAQRGNEPIRQPEETAPAFALGPTIEYFPFDVWQSLAAEQVRSMRRFSSAGDPAGYQPLRIAIADFSRRQRGIACSPSQVVVTMGATQALDLVARTVAKPGDAALIEDPSDPRVWQTFANARVKPIAVPVDDEGADIDAVDPAVWPTQGPRVLSLTPVRQYPLGVSLSPAREKLLLRRMAQWNAWTVELDGTFTVRPPRDPLIANRNIDESRVIYHASLSWVLFRSLRMGYIVAPNDIVPGLLATRKYMDVHPPLLEQAILAEFIARGHLDAYVEKMQAVNEERRRALVEAWPSDLGAGVRMLPTAGGLGNVVMLPQGANDEAIVRAARAQHMEPLALSSWYGKADRRGLLLGFAGQSPAACAEAVKRLAPLIAASLRSGGRG